MVIEDAIRRANHSLAVAVRVPCQADPRLEIVLVSLNSLLKSQSVIGLERERIGWRELWGKLYVVTQAIVQCEVGLDLPGVLPEQAERNVAERIFRVADALDVAVGNSQSVSLDGGESRDGRREA